MTLLFYWHIFKSRQITFLQFDGFINLRIITPASGMCRSIYLYSFTQVFAWIIIGLHMPQVGKRTGLRGFPSCILRYIMCWPFTYIVAVYFLRTSRIRGPVHLCYLSANIWHCHDYILHTCREDLKWVLRIYIVPNVRKFDHQIWLVFPNIWSK